MTATLAQWTIGGILILSSLGVILARKPVHASLSFLLTLLMLASLYLVQSAQFTAVMQVLVYAGAILVIFMYVVVLFQDAHEQIEGHPSKSSPILLIFTIGVFLVTLLFWVKRLMEYQPTFKPLSKNFGTVESLGHALYVDFFFPFEIIILLFLVALVGALYIGKKER